MSNVETTSPYRPLAVGHGLPADPAGARRGVRDRRGRHLRTTSLALQISSCGTPTSSLVRPGPLG